MWGALIDKSNPLARSQSKVMAYLKANCAEARVLPYFVPAGGFMVTPLYDVSAETIEEIGDRLNAAVRDTIKDLSDNTEL
jgi:hypothetical protein